MSGPTTPAEAPRRPTDAATDDATRLDRASNLLTDPRAAGLSLGEIAFRCGFLDPGYFARLFRKRFSVTPSRWRQSS